MPRFVVFVMFTYSVSDGIDDLRDAFSECIDFLVNVGDVAGENKKEAVYYFVDPDETFGKCNKVRYECHVFFEGR